MADGMTLATGQNGRNNAPDFFSESVEEVVRLEQREQVGMGLFDHVADRIAAFAGSMLFFWANALWFAGWITWNAGLLGLPKFDPFPFPFLTFTVSLEAIFLTVFVLISQNRQALQADRRAKIDLHVNTIAERELTKLMALVGDVHEHLGLAPRKDRELEEMKQPTYVEELADAVDEAQERIDPEAARGPTSAADTEA